MSRNEARRQRKLAKRRRKQNEQRLASRRMESQGRRRQVQRYSRGRIVDCFLSTSIDDEGIANVLLSREAGSGEYAAAVFLVDRYCLGVKNAMVAFASTAQYSELVRRFQDEGVRKVAPETARRLVEDAVAFAQRLGFSPHPDYFIAREIFGDIDPQQAEEWFEMGREGKPFYLPGPYDSPTDTTRVVATLERICGAGNYDYLCPVGEELLLPGFLNDDAMESDGEEEHEAGEALDGDSESSFRIWRLW